MKPKKRPFTVSLFAMVLLASFGCEEVIADPDPVVIPPIHTPAWAFEPWISKDISDGPDTYAFLQGFQERDIPVGVMVLDSPWETNYNTLIPNEERYPDFAGMVADFRAQDVRTVLWMTQMLNAESYDLELGGDDYGEPAENLIEAASLDYLVNDAETYFWWKGTGAAIDFFNPDASQWWRDQQTPLLEMGVAGWKLDFGEQYLPRDVPLQTAIGEVEHQAYSERYYQDFWEHGATTLGTDEFLTMVRPYDESYGFPGRFYARPEHAPVAWVGDQYRDQVGLEDALDHIFRSAEAGYTVLGSDIGGYLDTAGFDPIAFDLDVFQRWTMVSAFHPFFQLHGRQNLAPWTVPVPERQAETVDIYRYAATLHHAMVPYWYSRTEESYATGRKLLDPVGDEASWPGDWRFLVGDEIFVAPFLNDERERSVELPEGQWLDWWKVTAGEATAADFVTGTVTFTADNARDIPVYVKAGAIIPMRIDSDVLGLPVDSGRLSLLVVRGEGAFTVHEEDRTTWRVSVSGDEVSVEGAPSDPIVLLVP